MNFNEKKIWNLLRKINIKLDTIENKEVPNDNSDIEKRLIRIERDLNQIKNKLK